MLKHIYLFLLLFSFHLLPAQNIIFQEEFDSGIPSDWTNNAVNPANPDLTWEWSADGTAPNGAWWLDRPALLSPSIDNGCAFFDSDYYQTGGTASNWGMGPIPGPHTVELISPVIDCSNASNLILKFHQYYRPFLADAFVSVSGDGGASWTNYFVNQDVATNIATTHYDVRYLDISDIADNNPTVQIKFVFEGTAYIWLIDDIIITEKPAYQINLERTIRPPFYAFPKSQVEAFGSGGLVCNEWGENDQTQVVYDSDVMNENNNLVYGGQTILPNGLLTDSCALMTFQQGPDWAAHPKGTYKIISTVFSANQNAFNSDFYLDEFVISDSTIQKDHSYLTEGATGSTILPWEIGYDFPIIAGGHKVYNIEAAFSGNIAGGDAYVRLYEITNPDFNTLTVDELVKVGEANRILQDGENYELLNFEMIDLLTLTYGIPLEEGKQYLVTAGVENQPNVFLAMGYDIDYSLSGYSSHMVIVDGELFTGGYGEPRYAPVIRVHLRDENISSTEEMVDIGDVSLFPNPAVSHTQLQIELTEKSDEVAIRLLDISGKLLRTWNYKDVSTLNLDIEVDHLASGEYFVEIKTDQGREVLKLTVE